MVVQPHPQVTLHVLNVLQRQARAEHVSGQMAQRGEKVQDGRAAGDLHVEVKDAQKADEDRIVVLEALAEGDGADDVCYCRLQGVLGIELLAASLFEDNHEGRQLLVDLVLERRFADTEVP